MLLAVIGMTDGLHLAIAKRRGRLIALFTGEAVHAYLGHLPDATVEEMLNELAIELGVAQEQERIYVAFGNRTWILDAGDRLIVPK